MPHHFSYKEREALADAVRKFALGLITLMEMWELIFDTVHSYTAGYTIAQAAMSLLQGFEIEEDKRRKDRWQE